MEVKQQSGLQKARRYAVAAYDAELLILEGRHTVARANDRIRKLMTPRGIARLPDDLRAIWDWHREYTVGFERLPFEFQKAEVLSIPAVAGANGYKALLAAAYPLRTWWMSTGRAVTVTKFGSEKPTQSVSPAQREDGNVYKPSPFVTFLAGEFRRLQPSLRIDVHGRDQSIDAAFRVASVFSDPAGFP